MLDEYTASESGTVMLPSSFSSQLLSLGKVVPFGNTILTKIIISPSEEVFYKEMSCDNM